MHRSRIVLGSALALMLAGGGLFATGARTGGPLRFGISFPAARSAQRAAAQIWLG